MASRRASATGRRHRASAEVDGAAEALVQGPARAQGGAPTEVQATTQGIVDALVTAVNTGQTAAPNCPATALVLTARDQTQYAFYQITGSPPSGQLSGALCEILDINNYPTELTYNSADTQLTTVTECTTVSGTACTPGREHERAQVRPSR